MILGKGSYGAVSARDGKAVKKFGKLSHLIQEYMALQYLSDCPHIVHARGVDFKNLELHMELYDSSLRNWFEYGPNNSRRPNSSEINIIIKDILRGLVELHDRSLAHGDLKPGNILVRLKPLGAVLGDCGFVSVAKYAKVDRTAPVYRDPIVSHDFSHDMFSFGICLLELIGDIKINRQATYEELREVVREKITNEEYKKIIYNLLHEDKSRRPSARALLYRLYGENPPRWIKPVNSDNSTGRIPVSIYIDDRIAIRKLMKDASYKYRINRSKKGYGALISFLDNHNIHSSKYQIYTAVTLMILSSIFGKSGFMEQEVFLISGRKHSNDMIYKILEEMLNDSNFINLLLLPPEA